MLLPVSFEFNLSQKDADVSNLTIFFIAIISDTQTKIDGNSDSRFGVFVRRCSENTNESTPEKLVLLTLTSFHIFTKFR